MATAAAAVRASAPTSVRISALDGWRGIAILLVLADHLQLSALGRYYRPWLQTGQHGVTVFFVLSGFLITSKLLEPKSNLRRFYLRRFFRLMPAAWCYLAFLAVVVPILGAPALSLREAASCLLFYRNYLNPKYGLFAGHYWSLSVEEQFYLVWPCLLLAFRSRRAAWTAGIGAFACATYRLIRWNHYDRIPMIFRTEVRIGALLLGCLLAIAIQNNTFRLSVLRWSRLCTVPLLGVIGACIFRFHDLPPLVENLSIALLIAASALQSRSLLARSLSIKWLMWLGTISYSVYIWQQFFFQITGSRGLIFGCIGLPLCVLGSYYYVETPCIRLGRCIESKLWSSVARS